MTTRDNEAPAAAAGFWNLGGDRPVTRIGYGAMRLAGPGVFGPPADRAAAIAVLRRVVELGINHIDTSDYYGPHVVNELIRAALHPYPDDLVLVTKVGNRRDEAGGWPTAREPDELRAAVRDNIDRLGVPALDLVNLRFGGLGPEEGSLAREFTVLAELRERGLIRHLGVSNVTAAQIDEAAGIAPVAEVQNHFNIGNRANAAVVDLCAARGIAYVPFFPLGGSFEPVDTAAVAAVAGRHGATPAQIALAWLLARSPNILVIPGTASTEHLAENVAAGAIRLTERDLAELD